MKCKLLDEGKPPRRDVQYIPNLYLMRPRFEYIRFLNDPEHAHALRRNIIPDDEISQVKGGDKPLQIGIIQRPDSRRVDNLEDIRDALQIALPDAEVDMTDFNFTTVNYNCKGASLVFCFKRCNHWSAWCCVYECSIYYTENHCPSNVSLGVLFSIL